MIDKPYRQSQRTPSVVSAQAASYCDGCEPNGFLTCRPRRHEAAKKMKAKKQV